MASFIEMAEKEPASHFDDEYSRAGIMDPKILITTSREPSSKLLQFAKVLSSILHHRMMILRGTQGDATGIP